MKRKSPPSFSEEHKLKISQNNARYWLGKKRSPELIEKLRLSNLGKSISQETRRKISESLKGKKHKLPSSRKGKTYKEIYGDKAMDERLKRSIKIKKEKSHWWKGGITELNYSQRKNIMNSFEYRLWRKSVYERDNYNCIWCGQKGGKLQADHIKPFRDYPELRFAIDNGRTLCIDCHKKTNTWGRPKDNLKDK